MELEVRREVLFNEAPEAIWRALTDSEQLAQWFANEVELVAERGGRGVFRWDDGAVRYAVVDELEPGRRVGFRWHEEGREDEATHVELLVEEVPEGTRLTVVETAPASAPRASAEAALAGEWSWGVALLAGLPRLRRLARV